MTTAQQQQLGQFLQYVAQELDIPPELDAELTDEYNRLGDWLREDNAERFSTDSDVYTQGSRRLGTLVRPVRDDEDYDIDIVYLRHLAKTGITQDELKQQAGDQLRRYTRELRESHGRSVSLLEKQRCWRIQFGDRYHMDVLPALPDEDAWSHNSRFHEHGIIITDKDLVRWQPSNPKGYAEWFASRMSVALYESRQAMAKAASVDVEEVPEHSVRTPLHRVVQLLKRHRDLRYEGNPDDKPISVIITTLAARAYGNETDVYEAMQSIAEQMPDLIEKRNGQWWVPNPVAPSENFADKWRDHPERAERFFEWMAQVEADLDRALHTTGIQKVAGVLGESFGAAVASGAAKRFGDSMKEARDTNKLTVSADTATLGLAGGMSVVPHTFFGDVHKAPKT
ncbi:MAG: nucleotidyltransferase [Phycisphaerales bacterium]|nr:nucleotidyltransferase [Phycisphaerales bacterium]